MKINPVPLWDGLKKFKRRCVMAQIIRHGGKIYILPERGGQAPRPQVPGIIPAVPGQGLQPTQPTIRPKVAYPEVLFHWLPLSECIGKKTINFFTRTPDPDIGNGNFTREYIQMKMLIQAIKFDFLPTEVMSYIAPTGAYDFRTAFNAFSQGIIRLKIDKKSILEYALHDLFPPIESKSELLSATNDIWKIYHQIKPSKFTPFKDLIGIDHRYVEPEENVHVEIELPQVLSVTETANKEVSNTLKVKVSLLVRPERRIHV